MIVPRQQMLIVSRSNGQKRPPRPDRRRQPPSCTGLRRPGSSQHGRPTKDGTLVDSECEVAAGEDHAGGQRHKSLGAQARRPSQAASAAATASPTTSATWPTLRTPRAVARDRLGWTQPKPMLRRRAVRRTRCPSARRTVRQSTISATAAQPAKERCSQPAQSTTYRPTPLLSAAPSHHAPCPLGKDCSALAARDPCRYNHWKQRENAGVNAVEDLDRHHDAARGGRTRPEHAAQRARRSRPGAVACRRSMLAERLNQQRHGVITNWAATKRPLTKGAPVPSPTFITPQQAQPARPHSGTDRDREGEGQQRRWPAPPAGRCDRCGLGRRRRRRRHRLVEHRSPGNESPQQHGQRQLVINPQRRRGSISQPATPARAAAMLPPWLNASLRPTRRRSRHGS